MPLALFKKIRQYHPELYYKILRCKLSLKKKLISDHTFIKRRYRKRHGVYPDLANPTKYSEYVVRISTNTPSPLMMNCADKYAVREHVAAKAGTQLLNELYGVYSDFSGLYNDLPKFPDKFVIKATHGAAWNYICRDKAGINEPQLRAQIRHWLKSNFYYAQRELIYKDIPPRVICEKYLEDDSGELADYKVYCFRGEPKFLTTVTGRYSTMTYNTYDTEGNYLDIDFMGHSDPNVALNKDLPLEKLLEYSRMLSSNFEYVRVDFYFLRGRIIFGELTFTPGHGNYGLSPAHDLMLGKYFIKPQNSN
jgi:hypothetical protein